jgi:hypothetical protein
MELQELKEHLRLHVLWIQNDENGKRADLSGANLYGADLYGANLYGANLYGANLYGADLYGANLYGADLSGANLSGANLSGANLYGANLYGADLSGANLYGADLYGANLSGANLSGANLSGANLYGADLSGANLSKTLLENKVILSFIYNKHTAYYFGLNEILIGCHKHSIEHWLENYKTIGKASGYSDIEIEKYGRFIKGCANIHKDNK